jgi:hypothetical protein
MRKSLVSLVILRMEHKSCMPLLQPSFCIIRGRREHSVVVVYGRFITVWDGATKGVKTRVTPVGLQTVLVEVKKYRSQF